MGRKASFIPKPDQTTKPIYLTINADESEPGTFKDREIMLRIPHALIEGAVITCHAIGANTAFIYLRGEYLHEYEVMAAALDEALEAEARRAERARHRHLGDDRDPPRRGRLHLRRGDRAPRVARGQARPAALEAAVPGHLRRVRVADAHQQRRDDRDPPDDRRNSGGKKYAKLGVENSAGTRVFSLSGNVVNGGNYELELGTPLRELIFDIGGGIPDGRAAQGVHPGRLVGSRADRGRRSTPRSTSTRWPQPGRCSAPAP